MNSLGRKDGGKEKKQSSVFTKETFGVVLILFSTLLLICLITRDALFSVLGQYVNAFLLGCFGYFAFALDVFGLFIGVLMVADKKTGLSVKQKVLITTLFIISAILVNIITMGGTALGYGEYLATSYLMAGEGITACSGGGFFTSVISYPVSLILSDVGSYVVLAILIVLTGYFLVADFVKMARFGGGAKRSKFRSSYVKESKDENAGVNTDNLEVKEYPIDGVEFASETENKPTQKLFVNDANNFAFKSGREIKNDEKSASSGVKLQQSGNGINVASVSSSSYSSAYGSEMQQRLDYIKKPATINLEKTISGSSYGVTVSKPIPPRDEKVEPVIQTKAVETEQTPTPVIPLYEHDESLSKDDSAEAHARSFSSAYAEIEDVDVANTKAVEVEETFHPIRGEETVVTTGRGLDIPLIDETTDDTDEVTSFDRAEAFDILDAQNSGDKQTVAESVREFSDVEETSEIEEIDDAPTQSRIIRDNTRSILFDDKDSMGESLGYTSRVSADNNSGSRRSLFDETERDAFVEPEPEIVEDIVEEVVEKEPVPINREYFRPPFDLLENYTQPINADKENHQERMEIIQKTLEEFRINAIPQSYIQGPSFTRYEIMMPAGISVKNVLRYDDDLKMRLKAKDGVRIEAPIPGKDLVGIEVANNVKTMVGFRNVMEGLAENPKKGSLVFAVGKDIVGNAISYDLAKGPHYLVAGATGSGKSVCLHVLIVSLLMRYSPEELKLVLVDPKSVEFRKYDHIPHLLVDEIVTDAKRAITLLQWAYDETNRRNEMFIEYPSVSNIDDYNAQVASDTVPKLPRIVFVIDELADLMEACKKDLEEKIRKIAAKSRSAGIHLVLATQRPSVDVITGTIKANLPSRIALRVMNYADSSTILSEGGAEKLLGNGDMLYKDSTMGNYERYQGAYISGREISKVVNYIIENNKAYFDDGVKEYLDNETRAKVEDTDMPRGGDGMDTAKPVDAFFLKALSLAVNTGTVSISQLQRRLGIGYARAGALVDKMETLGYVSANEGSKARRVLLTREEYQDKYGNLLD